MRLAALALLLACGLAGQATGQPIVNSSVPIPPPSAPEIEACLTAASNAHNVPAPILVMLLRIENGRLGRVTANVSGAPPDVGPMQVNAMWLGRLAARWGTTREAAFLGLRDVFCTNVEAGAWILRSCLDRRSGDFWADVGCYHSSTPHFREKYLRGLQAQARAIFQETGGR